MEEYLKKDFEKLLKHGGLDAHRWMKATNSNAARVYDRNLEGLELTVDLYATYARVVDYSSSGYDEDEITEIKDIVSRFLYIPLQNVIFVERKKREGREQHEKTEESTKIEVLENGLSFECELSMYADTGLFFDQVNTRALVRDSAIGRRVLNLFCYTGSFSVYAAYGGAESVKSVDLSNVYSEWARRNLERNGFLDKDKYEVIAMDARKFLQEALERKDVYDLVIFDPPAFSNSHKADTFDVQKDYLWFLSAINRVLSKDGAVVFSENLSQFSFDKSALSKYFNVREITREVLAPGFSAKRKQLRVWILEKTATMKEEYLAVTNKRRRMDNELKDESLERLTLADEKDFGKVEKRERKGNTRSFDFERRPESRDFRGGERRERRDTHSRDHERRSKGRYDREDRDRRDFSKDRSDRRDSYDRDNRDRRDYRDRDRDSYRRDDRRDSFDRYDRYERRDKSDRDYPRRDFSERRDSYDRRDRRDNDRRDSFRRDDREGRDRRSYGRDGERRSGNFRSQGRGDNETSRFYREERGDRRSFRDEGPRKKTSKPKPYGYDSFMETKNREKATAFWLQGQEVKKNPDEDF